MAAQKGNCKKPCHFYGFHAIDQEGKQEGLLAQSFCEKSMRGAGGFVGWATLARSNTWPAGRGGLGGSDPVRQPLS